MNIAIHYEVDNISDVYEEYVTMAEYKTSNSEYKICKYCGETDIRKFKSDAHLIPEFTGNKNWFCENECDECNNYFSVYEYSLKSFGAFKNAHLPIDGKKKFPRYTDDYHDFVIQFQENGALLMQVKEKKDFFKLEKNTLEITSFTMPFVPLNVYKCLVKIGFSLMEQKDFKKFKSGISWLKDKKMNIEPKIPHTMLYNPNGKPVIKPIAILLKRKGDYNCPEFSLLFIWGFYSFQIFLPFNENDEKLDYSELKLPILSNFITINPKGEKGLAHFNMNELKMIRRMEKVNFNLKQK